MEFVYHGSSVNNLKKLEPHNSTHGNFVYATPYREMAIIFAKNCGDDYTYALYYNNQDKIWNLVETMPNAFKIMFGNSASIYTLNAETFKDMNTGFVEVLSPVGVDILKEEYIPNVYDEVKKMEKNGLIKLYDFYNQPAKIKNDKKRLIDGLINYCKNYDMIDQLNKKSFSRLILFHPELMNEINKKMIELKIDDTIYNKDDILKIYNKMINSEEDIYDAKKFAQSIKANFVYNFPDLNLKDNNQLMQK